MRCLTHAITRVTSIGLYRKRQGELVANTPTDLVKGTFASTVDREEFGASVASNLEVWTGTDGG